MDSLERRRSTRFMSIRGMVSAGVAAHVHGGQNYDTGSDVTRGATSTGRFRRARPTRVDI